MNIGVRLLGLNAARFETRIAELAGRLDATGRRPAARNDTTMDSQEVSDGERELGPAAGDLRDADG